MSWFGLLFVVAGVWVAVAAVYKLLRDDDRFVVKGIATAGVSSVAMWILSSSAAIMVDFRSFYGIGRLSDSMDAAITSASFENFMLCALIMATAVIIVYAARRSPLFDRFVAKAARPGIALLVTAVAAALAALTASMVL